MLFRKASAFRRSFPVHSRDRFCRDRPARGSVLPLSYGIPNDRVWRDSSFSAVDQRDEQIDGSFELLLPALVDSRDFSSRKGVIAL